MTASKYRTIDLVIPALCTALLAVCAQIAIPLPNMVLTLQTFGVAFCGYLLTTKYAGLCIAAYLLLGTAGVPVFSSMRGGLSVLTGVTGGFLIGFIPMILLCSLSRKRVPALLLGMLGLLICELLGTLQFMLVTNVSFPAAALKASLPYLPKDAVSVLLAWLLTERLRRYLPECTAVGYRSGTNQNH